MPSSRRERLRYFTPGEANDLLPLVANHLEQATRRAKRHREIRSALDAGMVATEAEKRRLHDESEALRVEALEILDRIGKLGVDVRGLDDGQLDFPALRHGVEVLLCWRRGEPSVQWWHPVQGGLPERRRLEDGDSGAWEWCS